MGKWDVKELIEISNIISGYAFKSTEFIESGIKCIKITNVGVSEFIENDDKYLPSEYLEKFERFKISKNDVVISLTRPIINNGLKVSKVPNNYNNALINQRVAGIQQIDNISNIDFIFYYLRSSQVLKYVEEKSKSLNQPNLSVKDLGFLKIPLPPLPEQQCIVKKLDGLFAKIDKAIGLLEENIAHTQALMGSVLDKIYSDGDIMLKDACILGPKKSEVKDVDDDLEVSFLPMKDLNEHDINFVPNEIKKISEVYKGYTYFTDGDIIVAKVTPCFENGKAGIAKDLTNGIGFGSSEYHVLRPNDKVLPEWIYFSVITEQIKVTGRENMTGAGGLKRIPRKFLEEWKIPLPKISDQKIQIEKLKKLQEENKNLENSISKKINHLKALKSSFLDQAFKGQL